MGNLSKNFSRYEFACKCGCGQDTVDSKLICTAQWLRDATDSPITVSSGNRCEKWNAEVGGSKSSLHLASKAMDFKVEGYASLAIYHLLDEKYPEKFGLGLYAGWCHIDVRDGRARWDGSFAPKNNRKG